MVKIGASTQRDRVVSSQTKWPHPKPAADLAGVGKTVIYDIEKGKETIRLSTLQKVLRVLNVKISFTSPLMEAFDEKS